MASSNPKENPGKAPAAPSKAAQQPPIGPEQTHDDIAAGKSAGRDLVGASLGNLRRANVASQLFGISILVTLGTAAALIYWTGAAIDKAVAQALAQRPPAAPVPAAPVSSLSSSADFQQQMAALQTQLDTWRREQLLAHKELRESIERVSTTAAASAGQPLLIPAGTLDAGTPGSSRIAEMVPQITPTQKEFIQLKERNRLTAYADEAIATGLRKPLETIVEYLRDSGSEHLHDAAQAEYLRVIRTIWFLQRENPSYRLPVGEIFKNSAITSEADLTTEQLHSLLADHAKQPWEARVRAAILLKNSTDPQTDARLIAAMHADPSLDVAKHAQICFEQRTQRRFRSFDLPAIDAWWEQQHQKPATEKKPAD
ncbi:MAG: hypothetical protein IPK32_25505 [Verrucomicrobiaceae bacterium]|nr:hypothetical protein [Verrucomicrobiaceae bacterium]